MIKDGRRAGSRTVVVHAQSSGVGAPRLGLVVSKGVGGSVVRHRVSRRLRGIVAGLIGDLPPGLTLIIRALPAAATASSTELRADLGSTLRRVLG